MASRKVPSALARLAQSAERKALNLVVVGSSPTVGAFQKAHWRRCASLARSLGFNPSVGLLFNSFGFASPCCLKIIHHFF